MKVHALYFSATGTTRKVTEAIASAAAERLGAPLESHSITTPKQREEKISFGSSDLVIFGSPVYIGRVPNLIKPYMETICGGGALGVPVVVYGNRNFDDALIELRDLMVAGGFRCCLAAAAFVGEHSFSTVLGSGRPDAEDLAEAASFGKAVAEAAANEDYGEGTVAVPGRAPYQFFKAVDDEGRPFDIRKAKPQTDPAFCNECGYCARICPMGAINEESPAEVPGICIKCNACVKRCPRGAKYFDDTRYLEHLSILERNYAPVRRKPEFFWSGSPLPDHDSL